MKEIDSWRNRRIASLKDKNGWLSLAGLFWLEEGKNGFGSDQTNDIIFPAGKAPDFIGSFVLEGKQVRVKVRPDVKVLHEGEPVHDMILQSDENGTPTILSLESLSWYIIKRGEKLAVRLKDSENPRFKQFKGINSYPIDSAWRIPAHFESFEKPNRTRMATILGTVEELTSPGVLVFEIQDKTYQLDVIAEPEDDQFWVIFGDQTNRDSTYGGGRYLYVDKPESDSATIIDFNKAYNPPCVFSEFSTCPLPHERNRLPVKIIAGEKNYENGPH
ncbi:MAG: DUF1684 domain-containing protein [Candidatus Neomarinimicrobiota bacterium]